MNKLQKHKQIAMKITKKTEDRIKNNLAKFQKVLSIAKDRE